MTATTARALRAEVLRPLPRRASAGPRRAARHGPPPLAASRIEPVAPFWHTVWRALAWLVAASRLGLRLTFDRLRGRTSARDLGRRFRQTFQELGDTAIRIGQFAATRVDILSEDFCEELSTIVDDAPPFPAASAIERIEQAAHRPASEIFSDFDLTPLSTSTMASVYRATLSTGERVVVKVRRPGVVRRLAVDLRLVAWLARVPEALAITAPDYFTHLCEELRSPLLDELDFAREARFQRIFRRHAKKARFGWLSAPRVYSDLCGGDVIVSELVDGVSCADLMKAVDRDDHAALASLAAQGITPARVARRVLRLQLWSFFEALFFHADARPENILIQEDSRLVILDFGACQDNTQQRQASHTELMARLLRNDVSGMADVALRLLSPLPRVDSYELKKHIEGAYHRYLFALRDRRSAWWERAPMRLWLALMQASRSLNFPVRLDTTQVAHAAMLFDSVAYRLDPHLKLVPEYRRYRRQAIRRSVRRTERRLQKVTPRLARETLLNRALEASRQIPAAAWEVDTLARDLPVQFSAVVNKGAYVAAVALRTIGAAGLLILVATIVQWVEHRLAGTPGAFDVGRWVNEVLKGQVVVVAMVVLVLMFVRQALFRLLDRDVGQDWS
jgi:predicted unusual protein kinase regulating ubiquinone biosynthesis (AarF/ABC1/UbiB family)